MARQTRSKGAEGEADSSSSIDRALYELPPAAVAALETDPEFRMVLSLLRTPIGQWPWGSGVGARTQRREKSGRSRPHPIRLIARLLKRTPRYVTARFFALTNLRLRDVILRLSVSRSAIALRDTDAKIGSIGTEEAYSSGSAFSRHFEESSGHLPSEYRAWSRHRKAAGSTGAGDVTHPGTT